MENEDFISSGNIDLYELWQNILEEIAKDLSAISFDVWIKPLQIEDIKENTLVLSAPTKSAKNTVLQKYKDTVIACAHKVYSAINQIEIFVQQEIDDEPVSKETKTQERVYVDENTKKNQEIGLEEKSHQDLEKKLKEAATQLCFCILHPR